MPYDSIAHPSAGAAVSDTSVQTKVDVANLTMSPIRVNQAGYRLVDVQEGRAEFYVVGGTATQFDVVDLQGTVVASGTLASTGLSASGQVKSNRVIDATRSPNPMMRGYPKTGAISSGVVSVGIIPAKVPGGKYRIKVGTATSASFVVSANLYGMVRDATIKFFGIQRSGSLADETGLLSDTLYSPSWFRNRPAHTWDGWNIDTTGAGAAKYRWKGALTGGWYDCGDHLKETRTQSFALAILGATAATMPEKDADSYGFNHNDTRRSRTDGVPDIVREARWGSQFALKAWRISGGGMTGFTVDSSKLYLSVGDFGKDHGWWGQPQNQDLVVPERGGRQNRLPRRDYGTASLGDWAAGLAFTSRLYRPFDRTGWCDTALKAARDLYELAKKVNRLEKSSAYSGESKSEDDLALASIALFWATREKKYLDETISSSGLPNGKEGICGSNQANLFPGSHFEGGFFGCTSDQVRKTGANTDWASVQSVALYSFFKLFLQEKDTAAAFGIDDATRGLLAQRTIANVMANLAARSQGTAGKISFPQIGRSGMDVSYNLLNYDSLWYSMQNQQEWVWNRYQMGNIAELYMYWDMTRYLDPSRITLPDLPNPVWNREKIEKALINGTGVILGMNPWDMSMLLGVGDKNPGHPHHRAANPEGKNVPGANYNYRIPVGALYGGIVPGGTTTQLFEQWEEYHITETCLDGSAVTLLALTGLAENVPNEAPRMDVIVLPSMASDTLALVRINLDKWGTVKLEYGTDSLLTTTTAVLGGDTSNTFDLRIHRLTPSTKYWFKVTGTDLGGKSRTQYAWVGSPTDSVRYNFTTTALPPPPPVYGRIKACNVTSDSADIMWYTSNGDYLSSVMFADSASWKAGNYRYVDVDQSGDAPVRFHHVRLYGLKERTTYYFRVGVPGGPYDEEVGCFRTPITDYKFKVYAGQYTESNGGFPMLSLNVVNGEERTFDSLSLRFYVRSTDTLWRSPGVPYKVLGPTPTMDSVPLTFENSIGVKYDICQAYNSGGFNKPCDDKEWGLNWSWGMLSTGVFMLKPVKIPDSYDPATSTWGYYLEMPLGPTVMNSQSRIRFDARLVARSEWPNPINQGNIDAFNFANSFVNRAGGPVLGDRAWWDEAGPNRASLGHEFLTRQDAPKVTSDWSWKAHSVAAGDPVDYAGTLKMSKDSFDIVRPEEAVNPYVAVYRKGVFVYGFSPDRKEQATKRTVFAMDVKYDAPFDVPYGSVINLASSASPRLTGTVDVYDQLIPSAKGFVTSIWVNGVELPAAQRRAAVSRNADGTWKLDLPLRLQSGSNKVDVTIFAGADSTEPVSTDACDEGRPCAFRNSYWRVNSVSKLTPSRIEVLDASGNAASRVTPDSSVVRVRVADGNANRKPAVADSVIATVRRAGAAVGTLVLVETGVNTGVFELGSVAMVSGAPTLGQLAIQPGDTVWIAYQDADDPEDTVSTYLHAVATWPLPVRGGIFRGCGGGYEARVQFDRAFPGVAAQEQYITDGGFEMPFLDRDVLSVENGLIGFWDATNVDLVKTTSPQLTSASGLQSLDLNSTTSGSISQTLSTKAGEALTLRYSWAVNTVVPLFAVSAELLWNGVAIDTIVGSGMVARRWETVTLPLVAKGGDVLEFRSLTLGNCGIMLDDVSVTGGASGAVALGPDTVVLKNRAGDTLVVPVVGSSTSFDATTRTLTIPLAAVPENGARTGRAIVSIPDGRGSYKVLSQSLSDSVGPWIDSARIVENLEGRLVDTIALWTSEPVAAPSKAWFMKVLRANAPLSTASVAVDSAWLSDASAGRWTVVVRTGVIKAGDQLLLDGAQVRDLAGNPAEACDALYRELKLWVRQAPVSRAWISDADGDGAPDLVSVVYKRVLRAGEAPDAVTVRFGMADSVRTVSVTAVPVDSVVRIPLAVPYSRSTTVGSGFGGFGSLVLVKSGDSLRLPLADSVAPNLLVANLLYGNGVVDTLSLVFSEALDTVAGTSHMQILKAAAQNLPAKGSPIALGTTVWKFAVDTNTVVPGDSVRPTASGRFVDATGRPTPLLHPWIEVQGSDRAPSEAWYKDSDGDGAVDHVVVRWARGPRTRPGLSFLWPDGAGGFDSSAVTGGSWNLDADGRTLTLPVGPFKVGVTSSTTTNLGRQNSAGTITSFPIHDSVPAVMTAARVGYASADGLPDTLHLAWSEPIVWSGSSPLVFVLSKGMVSPVLGDSTMVRPDGLGGMILFAPGDSSLTVFRKGDLVRLAPKSSGTQTDLFGNAAEDPTRWVEVVLGRRPPRFQVVFDPNKIRFQDWVLDPGPALQIWVRASGESVWIDYATGLPVPATQVVQGLGPTISLNQPLRGQAYLYDNQGTFAAKVDLSLLGAAFYTDALPKDASNQYEVRVQWNGKAATGKPAASGVYMMRLVLWQNIAAENEAPEYRVVNNLYRLGWEVPAK